MGETNRDRGSLFPTNSSLICPYRFLPNGVLECWYLSDTTTKGAPPLSTDHRVVSRPLTQGLGLGG